MRARACACQPRKHGLQGAELLWVGRLRATFTREHHDCICRNSILPIAGIVLGLMITVAWAAFLGIELFRAVEFVL